MTSNNDEFSDSSDHATHLSTSQAFDDVRAMRGSLSELRRMSTSSVEPRDRVDAAYAFGNRPRALSRASRASSRSCAVSVHSQFSDDVPGGILLNASQAAARTGAGNSVGGAGAGSGAGAGPGVGSGAGAGEGIIPLSRHRSRRMTRSSNVSLHSMDNQSEADPDDVLQTREDVFFTMGGDHSRDDGIDFVELDDLREAARQKSNLAAVVGESSTDEGDGIAQEPLSGGRPQKYYSHRPLVPQPVGGGLKDDSPSSATIDVPVLDSSKDNLREEAEVQFEKGRVYSKERFSFFASEFEDTIHAPQLSALVEEGQSFSELFNESSGTWWLDCMDPTDDEMRIISRAFGIHPLTTEDITTEESREKVELFKNYYFVCFHTFDHDRESEDFLEPVNVYIVVFRTGILSFHFSPIQHAGNVRKRIRQLRDYVSVSADWICYALIDDITDSFAPIIHEIEEEADIIEDSVYVARDDDFVGLLRRIGESRRKVMTLLRLLSGKADVIKMFAKRCQENWDNAPKGEIGLYLGDIQDHIFTMHQNLSVYERIFSRSHGNYMAQLQVESVSSNNRVTEVLGKVTMLGTLFLPMNLITGLFGMNVTVPGEAQGNVKWWLGIFFFMVGMGIILFFVGHYWFMSGENSRLANSSGVSVRSSAASLFSRRTRRERADPRLGLRD